MKRALSEAELSQLADLLAPRVAALLAARLTGANEPIVYSTRKGEGPPGYAHRAWQKVAPTIPGAARRGRWWIVAAGALAAWEAGQSPPSVSVSLPPQAQAWSPEGALASIGLRRAKGAA
jgi:hypothetical protein